MKLAAIPLAAAIVLAGCPLLEPAKRPMSGIHMEVGAADAQVNLTHRVDIEGSAGRIGEIAITDGYGHVTIDGTRMNALPYERIPWAVVDGVLYQVLAVSPDALYVIWIYCSDAGPIDTVWWLGTDGTPLHETGASGTCSDGGWTGEVRSRPQVTFPAANLSIPKLQDGFSVEGPGIDIPAGGPGKIVFENNPYSSAYTGFPETTYEAYMFASVDCSTRCGGNGWFELHGLLWNASAGRAFFGIVYLRESSHPVTVSYLISLPELHRVGDNFFDEATWERV